ncbi:hypothetical protein FO519_000796 [Halicephalobus sp. NKZ332]|nr:hypothetical protein FO519_000796 [Halicephalobus sp. NKZ332]
MPQDSDTSTSSVTSSNRAAVCGPNFFDASGLLPDSIAEEFVTVLASENSDYITGFDEYRTGFFITPRAVSQVFTICARLRLPDDVKYQALDIFDKFMCNQTLMLYDLVAKSERANEEKWRLWNKSFTILSRQLTLRMCTAIQIASKMQSFHESLSKVDVRKALTALGFPYTEDMIQKSELRILASLDFNVQMRRSPSQCVETYLSLLVRKHSELGGNIDAIYRYALFTLDFVFLNRDAVYTEILRIVHGTNPTIITSERIRRVAQDYCLLGTAACLVGVICAHGQLFSNQLLPDLCVIAVLAESDISDAVSGILRIMAKTI